MAKEQPNEQASCKRIKGDVKSHLQWVECKTEEWAAWKKEIIEPGSRSASGSQSSDEQVQV